MSSRIDIELTSTRDDGTWTWRAAGAKQPKGVLDGALLPEGAKVGTELRADVETSLDGTAVLAVLPPKTKARREPERIELVGRTLSEDELVTSTLVSRKGGGRGDRGDRGERGDRRPRGDGRPGGRDGGRPGGGPGGPGGRDGGRPGGRDGRPPRGDRPQGAERADRPARPRRDRPEPEARPKAKRLKAGRAHRKAAVDLLAPELQVIAEQVLRGGVPAVRQAIDKQNAEAKAAGQTEVKAQPLLAIAEQLLPALRAAEWQDKAEAAVRDLDDLDLRDLRSVVVAADAAGKDDASRDLAATLREGLTRRVEAEQAGWLEEIAATLKDGRVVRALRLSSRPPKAGAPLPAELASSLSAAASAALTADTMADRWATVLDALSFSPVRLTVAPASKPDAPSAELVAVVTKLAARVPKVAEAFGITPPAEGSRPARPRKRGKGSAKPGGGPAIPPPPPRPTDVAMPPQPETAEAPEASATAEAPVGEAADAPAGAPAVTLPSAGPAEPAAPDAPAAEQESEPVQEPDTTEASGEG